MDLIKQYRKFTATPEDLSMSLHKADKCHQPAAERRYRKTLNEKTAHTIMMEREITFSVD